MHGRYGRAGPGQGLLRLSVLGQGERGTTLLGENGRSTLRCRGQTAEKERERYDFGAVGELRSLRCMICNRRSVSGPVRLGAYSAEAASALTIPYSMVRGEEWVIKFNRCRDGIDYRPSLV